MMPPTADTAGQDRGSVQDLATVRADFPAQEFRDRLKRAQAILREEGIDLLVLWGSEGYPHGVRYFFGHWPSFEPALALVPVEGEPLLLTGPETEHFARERAPHGAVHSVQELYFWAAPDYIDIQAASLGGVLGTTAWGADVATIGLTPRHAFPASISEALSTALPTARRVDGDPAFVRLRSVKSPREIARLRAASSLAEQVFEGLLDAVRPGLSELEVMDLIHAGMGAGGSEAPAYFGWCASGPNTVNPIFRSTDRQLVAGDLVQVNVGPRMGGYSGSVGRAVGLGSLRDPVRRMLGDALELAALTVAELAPGRPAADVARVVGDEMRARGYSGLYGPAHATGMEECELPWIQESARFDLVPGMSFNVDIWVEQDGVGVRVEDGVVVTDSGCEVLSPRFHDVLVV